MKVLACCFVIFYYYKSHKCVCVCNGNICSFWCYVSYKNQITYLVGISEN